MKLVTRRPRPSAVFVSDLPGPDRKRSISEYRFRLTYRNPTPDNDGCVMVWEVSGGRMPYQIAAERTPTGVRWHCSCADAIYREGEQGHRCKHVRGLASSLELVGGVG